MKWITSYVHVQFRLQSFIDLLCWIESDRFRVARVFPRGSLPIDLLCWMQLRLHRESLHTRPPAMVCWMQLVWYARSIAWAPLPLTIHG
jgi:hypothetical protein